MAYENQTRPLIDYYRRKKLLAEVDGNREPELIAGDLTRFLKSA